MTIVIEGGELKNKKPDIRVVLDENEAMPNDIEDVRSLLHAATVALPRNVSGLLFARYPKTK